MMIFQAYQGLNSPALVLTEELLGADVALSEGELTATMEAAFARHGEKLTPEIFLESVRGFQAQMKKQDEELEVGQQV